MNLSKKNIAILWFTWHFYEMPKFLLLIWGNFISFGAEFFSVPLLVKTLFSPWRRYKWRYPKGFDIGGYFGTFISNIFSRLVGAVVRSFLIIAGIFIILFIFILGSIGFIIWFLIPFILILFILFLFF